MTESTTPKPASPLKEILHEAVDSAKAVLVDATKRRTQLLPTIILHRGGEQIAIISMEHSNRDDMLMVARAVVYSFEPDQFTWVHDSWVATTTINPVTGEEWGKGDMQDVADNHDGNAKGWITDVIMVVACNKAGDQLTKMLPYGRRGRRVEWKDLHLPEDGDDGMSFGGSLLDDIKEMMISPGMMQQATAAGHDVGAMIGLLGYERARAHQDCAAVKVLANPPPHWKDFPRDLNIMLSAPAGSVRQQVIKESLGSKGWHR